MNIKEVEDNVLSQLNEILLLSYGTDVYRQIIKKIERMVFSLEKKGLVYRRWQ